jgi:hypothetical protein
VPYAQVTLAQLRSYFYEQVGGNTSFWRTAEVDTILQESVRVFNCLTGFWRGRVDISPTVANQHWYTVPSGLTYLLRGEVNQRPLGSSSLWDLDYGQPNWEAESCISGTFPQVFAPAGVNLFAIWPASFAGGESLVVEGVTPAPVLTTVGSIDLGQDELEMILDYAGHIAQFKEGGQEFEASQLLLKEFLKQAGERNAVLTQSSKFRTWMGLTDQKKRPMKLPNERVGAR